MVEIRQSVQRQQALDLLRFPLAVIVLITHTWSLNDISIQGEHIDLFRFSFFREINYLIDGFLRGQSVPIFFFISGFLFFHGVEWNRQTYFRKLKSRVGTLLIPYLVWNTITIALLTVKYLPFWDGFRSGEADFQFSFKTLLSCFWNYDGGFFPSLPNTAASADIYPFNIPLWFLRDLMVAVVCTPLLYRILKYAKVYAVIGLATVWFILGYLNLGYVNQLLCAFFFFAWGGEMSINKKDLSIEFGRYFTLSMWTYPLLALFYVAAIHLCPQAAVTIKQLNILVGILFAYNFADWLLGRKICRPSSFLAASSFFIYVAHYTICSRLRRVCLVLLHPESDIALTGVYTLTTILAIGLLLGAYRLMERYTPRFLKVIAGR